MLGSEQAYAEESAESALQQLPAKIRDQLETDRLRREIALEQLRRELEQLKGSEDVEVQRKIERLGELRKLLEVNRDVRELLKESPELSREYDRVLKTSVPPQGGCACLENARVHWLGQGDQAGQVIVYLDGLYHDVGLVRGSGAVAAGSRRLGLMRRPAVRRAKICPQPAQPRRRELARTR